MKKYLIIAIIFLNSCMMDHFDTRSLYLKNNTNGEIYCFFSQDDTLSMNDLLYGDSISDKYKINAASTKELSRRPDYWDLYIENSVHSKMRLLIIENDTVNRYGWNRIIKENRISKIYRFDIADLDRIKWQVIYNGNYEKYK